MNGFWGIFLCCFGVCLAGNCPQDWVEFCNGTKHIGCYWVELQNVSYLVSYTICSGNKYESSLVMPTDLEERAFVINLARSKDFWLDAGSNPKTCYIANGVSPSPVVKSCNNGSYTVCKMSVRISSTPIDCSSLTTESASPTTVIMTEIETEALSTTISQTEALSTTDSETEALSTTGEPPTSVSSAAHRTVSMGNGETQCPCVEVCYTNYGINDIEIKVKNIQQYLSVNISTLSATVRKLTCAEDPRPSSAYIGYTGGIIMSLILLMIMALDCFPKAHEYRNTHRDKS
ncbi:uncharacterized protein LOC133175895 [Saccostrea echinata]|uniref:uncharacterized protein LOC133175895 n=1 Tax=Saccostrea echinata TaxID=191078 RepID=UPI002A82F69C|nr:uncharacterized protein LOC133175895 [Saccostrea echinata]